MRVGLQREQLVLLVFEVDGHRYAVDTDCVLEIVRAVQPVRLPKAPAVISGVIDARGEVLPLLDLRVRFGLPRTALRAQDVFVIVQSKTRRIAFRADCASELTRVPRTSLAPLSQSVPSAEFVAGTARLADGLLLICDVDQFLDEAELITLDAALATEAKDRSP